MYVISKWPLLYILYADIGQATNKTRKSAKQKPENISTVSQES